MLHILQNLDRRWIYLAMLLAVAIPIVAQKSFPEKPTKLVQDAFDYIEQLDEGLKRSSGDWTTPPAAKANWPPWRPPSFATAA